MKRTMLLGLSVFGLVLSILTLGAQLTLLLQPGEGAHEVTAKASTTAQTSFCINAVPVLNIGCNTTMSQGSNYSCLVNATDVQDDNLTFSTNGTIFNITADGWINFTPGNEHVGNHTAWIIVEDDSGCPLNFSRQVFDFSVANINDPPYLVQPLPDSQFPANATISAFFLTDYFADPDNDPLTFSSTVPSQFTLTLSSNGEVIITGDTCDVSEVVVFTATDPSNASADSNTVEIEITCEEEEEDAGSGDGGGAGGGGGGAGACRTEWECEDWFACLPTNQQWRRCYDLGGCEGEKYIKRICEFPGPPPACEENWLCSEWGQCLLNGTQTRTCDDLAACGSAIVQPSLTQECLYIATCNDGIKNGNETGIDCGGECAACSLIEKPAAIDERLSWLLIIVILSIMLISGVIHYYRAQIAQGIALLGFMLRHRTYKDILLDAQQRRSYFERLLAFEQLLESPAGKSMKPEVVYNTLSTLMRQYYVDALGVHSEAVPEEVAARCQELGLRHETAAMLKIFFEKLGVIEHEEIEYDEYFVRSTIEELRTIVCLTSDYNQEELMRPIEELPVSEEMSFYDEIFVRSTNALRAVQFHQLEAAKREYLIILTRYDPLSEEEKEQVFPQLQWLFGTVKFQSEVTGARVVRKA